MNSELLTRNFYDLFNMPVCFDIDMGHLQSHYRELAQAVHPDRFANGSDFEKRLSMQQTSFVNKAYQTLKNPIERAGYLLQLKGADGNFQNETTMDAGFLMEQMELRETLADIRQQKDPLDALDREHKKVKQQLSQIAGAFSSALQLDDLRAAKEWLRKMQFVQKAKHEIETLSAHLEDEQF